MRSSWKNDSDVKMIAGLSSWPDAAYTKKAIIAASVGADMARAVFAARMRNRYRTNLRCNKRLHHTQNKTLTLTYFISWTRKTDRRCRNGCSQEKNLITLIPPSSSCNNFTRLSVHSMALRRNRRRSLMMDVCTGTMRIKYANPARELGPRLAMSKPRQMLIWIGAAQPIWKKPQQKSMRETSVEM